MMISRHARYYDPRNGRFLSEDPIGFSAGDNNLYRYVTNDPLRKKDPQGLWTVGVGVAFSQWIDGAAGRGGIFGS